MITPEQWNEIQSDLWRIAYQLTNGEGKIGSYEAMLVEPNSVTNWWSGAFDQSEADEATIDSAAMAIAENGPLPDLSPPQRGRLALRLRLASRVIRAMSNRHQSPAKGWLPSKLAKISEEDALIWLLVDGHRFWIEILDETLLWADSVDHPEPYIRISPEKHTKWRYPHGPAQ